MMSTFLFLSAIIAPCVLSIGGGVTEFLIMTDAANGGDGSDLNMTLNWNDTQYSCTVNPNAINTPYSCDGSSASPITPNPQMKYFIKLEWSTSNPSLQIAQIKITDNQGSWYEVNQFCIAPTMQCTLDTAMAITPDSMPSCDQYTSKDSYDAISLGTDSKFSLLYVDIPIFNIRFANTAIEGGVRPPLLTAIGINTGASIHDLEYTGSVQWDTTLGSCAIRINSANDVFTCDIASDLDTVLCPGLSSSFWISWYSSRGNYPSLTVERVWFTDETETSYHMETFCQETHDWVKIPDNGPACSDPYTSNVDIQAGGEYTYVSAYSNWPGGPFPSALVAFIAPKCIYDYPDVLSNGEQVETLNEGKLYPDGSFGWGAGLYGNNSYPICPETREPTFDPTIDPTIDPTGDPTVEPTFEPTFVPTFDPTIDPTIDPTLDPTTDPSRDPTQDPTDHQTTAAPSPFEAIESTLIPTKYPTFTPTKQPSGGRLIIPNNVVFWGVLAAAIFLLCCILFFLIMWCKREKEEEAEESKSSIAQAVVASAPVVVATAGGDDDDEDLIATQDTYQEYDVGAINTQPSGVVDDDDAKDIELQEVDKQHTLDGVISGGVTGGGPEVDAGNEAVLNMLADGHETGGAPDVVDNEAIASDETEEFNIKV